MQFVNSAFWLDTLFNLFFFPIGEPLVVFCFKIAKNAKNAYAYLSRSPFYVLCLKYELTKYQTLFRLNIGLFRDLSVICVQINFTVMLRMCECAVTSEEMGEWFYILICAAWLLNLMSSYFIPPFFYIQALTFMNKFFPRQSILETATDACTCAFYQRYGRLIFGWRIWYFFGIYYKIIKS